MRPFRTTPEHREFPLDRILGIPEEIGFFVRTAIFGITVSVIYWFMTYEVAGTVLLGALGIVAAVISVVLWAKGGRGRARERATSPGALPVEGPFGDDTGLAPNPTLAPLEVGFGVMLALFAIPFGLWMLVVAIAPIAAGAIAWLQDVEEEQRRVLLLDGEITAKPPSPAGDGRTVTAAPPASAAVRSEAVAADEPSAGGFRLLAALAVIGTAVAWVVGRMPGRRLMAKAVGAIAAVIVGLLAMPSRQRH